MCVSVSSVGLLLLVSQTKRHPKTEMQIKPIDGTKIFKGRVAPPLWVCVFRGLPHLKIFFYFFCIVCVRCFFLKFFVPIVFLIFFLVLFYMLNFVKLRFIVYEVCIFVVF